jgi:hypothetical protein
VPIQLNTAGNAVAAATFALDFDPAHLTFDATDADENGLPDAVAFDLPAGMTPAVHYNVEQSRVEVVVYSMNLPLPLLDDGAIATVTLQVSDAITVSETSLSLDRTSLGDDQGRTVPLAANGDVITIDETSPAAMLTLYLPLIDR